MIKFTSLMRRNPDLTHDQFVDYHRNKHAPLFMSLPEVQQHVRRYIQSHPISEKIAGLTQSQLDGITDIWFDDVDGFNAVFGSDSYMSTIRPDEEKFMDLLHTEVMLSSEYAVHDPHDRHGFFKHK